MHRSKRTRLCGLFDHLVGAGKQRGRNSEAERVRGLEVNDQLEFWLGRITGRSPGMAPLRICPT